MADFYENDDFYGVRTNLQDFGLHIMDEDDFEDFEASSKRARIKKYMLEHYPDIYNNQYNNMEDFIRYQETFDQIAIKLFPDDFNSVPYAYECSEETYGDKYDLYEDTNQMYWALKNDNGMNDY